MVGGDTSVSSPLFRFTPTFPPFLEKMTEEEIINEAWSHSAPAEERIQELSVLEVLMLMIN